MEAHLLFHLALVSSPAQQRKQPSPELRNIWEKTLQESADHARPDFRLGGWQPLGNGPSQPLIGGGSPRHLSAPRPREFVFVAPPVVFSRSPFGLDPPLHLQPVDRRVK